MVLPGLPPEPGAKKKMTMKGMTIVGTTNHKAEYCPELIPIPTINKEIPPMAKPRPAAHRP